MIEVGENVDGVELVRYASLLWTNFNDNMNKYYCLELHRDPDGQYVVRSHYGRVDDLSKKENAGVRIEKKYSSLSMADAEFQSLFKQKTVTKGYRPVALVVSKIGSPTLRSWLAKRSAASGQNRPLEEKSAAYSIDPKLERLVSLLYAEAASQLTAVISASISPLGIETPLGVLTREQVLKGQSVLDEIEVALVADKLTDSVAQLYSGQFYQLIPHRFGRDKAQVLKATIRTLDDINSKRELLQLMLDLLEVNAAGASLDDSGLFMKYAALRNRITPLEPGTLEYENLKQVILSSQVARKDMEITHLYMLDRAGESKFKELYLETSEEIATLFHGSRASNMVGLLSRGLLLPHRIVAMGGKRTDYGLLGAGVYFASNACTSGKYCYPAPSSGTAFMLVSQVYLGKQYPTYSIQPKLVEPPYGYNSVHAFSSRHGLPSDFSDDEYVVYDLSQQRLYALVEFRYPEYPGPCTVKEETDKDSLRSAFGAPLMGSSDSTPMHKSLQNSTQIVQSGDDDIEDGGKLAAEMKNDDKEDELKKKLFDQREKSASDYHQNYLDYFSESQRELKLREDSVRREFASGHPPEDPYAMLINVHEKYGSQGQMNVCNRPADEAKQTALLNLVYPVKPNIGSKVIASKAQFLSNFDYLTNRMFHGLDWSNLFVAGGSILAALDLNSRLRKQYVAGSNNGPSDIDLFIWGCTEAEANKKLSYVFEHLSKKRSDGCEIIRTDHAVSILGNFPNRHVQIVLRLYHSPSEVLLGFDVDSCSVGFNGTDVFATERALRALKYRYNLVDLSRRSLTYEARLLKYAFRGFAVLAPGVDLKLVENNIYSSKRSTQLSGAAYLLWNNRYSARAMRVPKRTPRYLKQQTDIACDYTVVTLPWGPQWGTVRILRRLERQDLAYHFSRLHISGAPGHIFVKGLDSILSSTEQGPLQWVKDNPGRQLMTGSFHPLEDCDWLADAYGIPKRGKTVGTPSPLSLVSHSPSVTRQPLSLSTPGMSFGEKLIQDVRRLVRSDFCPGFSALLRDSSELVRFSQVPGVSYFDRKDISRYHFNPLNSPIE